MGDNAEPWLDFCILLSKLIEELIMTGRAGNLGKALYLCGKHAEQAWVSGYQMKYLKGPQRDIVRARRDYHAQKFLKKLKYSI